MLYDDLKIVLKSEFSSQIAEDALLKSIIQWISYARADRKKHWKELKTHIDFTEISAECITSLIEGYESFIGPILSPELTDAEKDTMNQDDDENLIKESSLLLYARNGKHISVFSCSSDELIWSLSYEFTSKTKIMRNIKVRDTLYRLSASPGSNYQRFSGARSVYSLPTSYLKNPPVLLNCFSMCGIENQIYLYGYNTNGHFNITGAISNDNFNADELSRSIYHYNCEIDAWFSVPPMKRRLSHSCMTTDNTSLYMIGGKCTDGYRVSYVQAYDCREKNWRELPSTPTTYIGHDSCVHQGKIYVAGVSTSSISHIYANMFDRVAGKWNNISNLGQLVNRECKFRLVSYKDKIILISVDNFKMFKLTDDLCHITTLQVNSLEGYRKEGDNDLSHKYVQDVLIF
jgi:hypothetical protein